MRLVLASTSPHRRAILEAASIAHEAVAPSFVEDHGSDPPEQIAIAFARAKAESVAARFPGAVVIGADQVPELDGKPLTKPANVAEAEAQLRALRGKTHRLWTAVAVHADGRTEHRLVVHHMHMRALGDAEITAYVARDRPIGCAGAYKVEAAGALLFSSMEGPDHTAIVGLPLAALADLLAERGLSLLL